MTHKKDWLEVAAGAALIGFGAITPIPDDVATLPIGLALIMDGMRWL